MIQHQGIWLPEGERHFPEWMTQNGELVDGKGTYQIKKLRAVLRHVKSFGMVVDVGAHVGLWSMHLRKAFADLRAFEPMPSFRDCFWRNVVPMEFRHAASFSDDGLREYCVDTRTSCRVVLYACALGDARGSVVMDYKREDSGGTHVETVAPKGHYDTELFTLDSFGLRGVGLIKIDCEGFEERVLTGARETVEASRPAVIVEQKPHKLALNYGQAGAPAVRLLESWGYVRAEVLSGDYIMVPK